MKVDAQYQSSITGSTVGGLALSPARGGEVQQPASTLSSPSQEDIRRILQGAAELITDFLSATGRNVSASVDQVSGVMVVKVVNPETGDLIRQIPSDEVLGVLRHFSTTAKGILVSQSA